MNDKEKEVIEAARDMIATNSRGGDIGSCFRELELAVHALDKPELITMDGEYTYRNGEPARILCTDAGGDWSVISLPKTGKPLTHKSDGSYSISGKDVDYDLIPVKKEPREWYIPKSQQALSRPDCWPSDQVKIEFDKYIKVREVLE